MALRKKDAPAREACIDNSSLNLLLVITAVILIFAIMLSTYFVVALVSREDAPERNDNDTPASADGDFPFKVDGITVDIPSTDESKNIIPADFLNSEKAILVDLTANEIVASRQGSQMIYPASMTKVMTLIVVVENLKSEAALDEILTIEYERGTHSGYGFEIGEKLSVEDLLYAAILQSDGVACLTLADYIAGSEANFVKLMNEKAAELGIGETTLFQNCTGLHHKYHYSTCRDIAIMMAYAMQNPLCTSVLTSLKYKPGDSFRPGDGCTFWHTFLHNQLSDGNIQPKHANIIGGKTGWTGSDSGYCIVSYAKGDNGHYYVSVTSKAAGWSANVDDILKIYNEYVK